MRIPKAIKLGDTIAIAAPSFGATTEPYTFRFQEAIRQFKERGYNVVIGDCCYKNDGLGISTDPKVAAAELEQFYLDPKIDAIFSCGGGELMCETVSYIDFKKLKKAPPKWFMGYSDNTNFILPLVTLCDVASIYGPNAPGFGKPWEQSEKDAWNILEGTSDTVFGYPMFQNPQVESEDPLSPYIYTDEKVLTTFISGNLQSPKTSESFEQVATKSMPFKTQTISNDSSSLVRTTGEQTVTFSGILLGGCLDCLVGLSGTKLDGVNSFNQKNQKVIWVLESCDYNTMDIRRALWHLRQNGWFTNASAFIFGRPFAAFRQSLMGVDEYNAATGILGDLGVPLVFDADIGHIDPAMPLVIGANAQVSVKGNDIKIQMGLPR